MDKASHSAMYDAVHAINEWRKARSAFVSSYRDSMSPEEKQALYRALADAEHKLATGPW